jgi:hypothetical protein
VKLTLCPHFQAHVKSLATMNRVTAVCSECGPRSWTEAGGTTDDPYQDQGWLDYATHVQKELIPMIDKSAVTMSLVPDALAKVDVKYATELGYCIMMDKPILALVAPGCDPPPKLKLVADEIVEGQPGDPGFEERFRAAMGRMNSKYGLDDDKESDG